LRRNVPSLALWKAATLLGEVDILSPRLYANVVTLKLTLITAQR